VKKQQVRPTKKKKPRPLGSKAPKLTLNPHEKGLLEALPDPSNMDEKEIKRRVADFTFRTAAEAHFQAMRILVLRGYPMSHMVHVQQMLATFAAGADLMALATDASPQTRWETVRDALSFSSEAFANLFPVFARGLLAEVAVKFGYTPPPPPAKPEEGSPTDGNTEPTEHPNPQ